MPYGRELLLLGEKRNAVLGLSEVQRYGTDSYGDADYVSIFGLRPAQWHAKGIRLLGRTAVECTRDALASAIGSDLAGIAASAPRSCATLVVDPFVGSGNTLFWLLRCLPQARGIGFELDPGVFRLTRSNLATLGLPIEILNIDFRSGLEAIPAAADRLLMVFIAPPWGDALDPVRGLDLRRTQPPIIEIVDLLIQRFGKCRLLCAIQLFEHVEHESLTELAGRFDWHELRTYGLNVPGQNHGILIGTRFWQPTRERDEASRDTA